MRTALTRMGLTYVVGVQSSARLWPPGAGPLPPKAWTGQGRPPTLMRRDAQNQPQSAEQLAKSLPADAWRDVAWREGVDKTLRSRFAAVRVLAEKRAEPSRSWRASSFVRLVVASISPRSVNISPTFSPKGGPRFCDINTSIRNCQTLQSAWTALLDRRDHFRGLSSVWLRLSQTPKPFGQNSPFQICCRFLHQSQRP